MITVRVAADRSHTRRGKRDVWQTFDVLGGGFAALAQLDENRIAPGASTTRRSNHEQEIVTYVHEGAVSHEDSTGHTAVIRAGEFERTTSGSGLWHSETNASRTNEAHVFHFLVRSAERGSHPSHEQRRFSAAERRGVLRVIASPDARAGSLRIDQDVVMYSAMLDRGQHVVHALGLGRSAWIHVVDGEVMVDDFLLRAGDGAGLTAERAVSVTAGATAEILLLDLAAGLLRS